jgi:hypothetical protein
MTSSLSSIGHMDHTPCQCNATSSDYCQIQASDNCLVLIVALARGGEVPGELPLV